MSEAAVSALLDFSTGKIAAGMGWQSNELSTARLDAELLLANVLGKSRSYLYAWPEQKLSDLQQSAFLHQVELRANGMPVAYLLGCREFWSLRLEVTPDVLIPRPETECLVAAVLERFGQEEVTVLDAGTGSGAIALAIASERRKWHVFACDASLKALKVAEGNALHHALPVHLFQGDWLLGLAPESLDIIVSNPPYIAEDDPHLESLVHEPASALVAGSDGLRDIRTLLEQAPQLLKKHGMLFIEHGYDQGEAVRNLFLVHGFSRVITGRDHSGHERFTYGVAGGISG